MEGVPLAILYYRYKAGSSTTSSYVKKANFYYTNEPILNRLLTYYSGGKYNRLFLLHEGDPSITIPEIKIRHNDYIYSPASYDTNFRPLTHDSCGFEWSASSSNAGVSIIEIGKVTITNRMALFREIPDAETGKNLKWNKTDTIEFQTTVRFIGSNQGLKIMHSEYNNKTSFSIGLSSNLETLVLYIYGNLIQSKTVNWGNNSDEHTVGFYYSNGYAHIICDGQASPNVSVTSAPSADTFVGTVIIGSGTNTATSALKGTLSNVWLKKNGVEKFHLYFGG